jgi:hypothetical protein
VLTKPLFKQWHHADDPAMHRRMIDTNVALGHHFLEIAKTERVGNVPTHAQQNHFKRIVRPLQNVGDVRSNRRSSRHCLIHPAARAFSSAWNFSSPALMRQSQQGRGSVFLRMLGSENSTIVSSAARPAALIKGVEHVENEF